MQRIKKIASSILAFILILAPLVCYILSWLVGFFFGPIRQGYTVGAIEYDLRASKFFSKLKNKEESLKEGDESKI